VSTLHFLLLFKNNDSTTKKASKICRTHSRKQNLVTTVPYLPRIQGNTTPIERHIDKDKELDRELQAFRRKSTKKKKWQKILSAEFIFTFFIFWFFVSHTFKACMK
jgi:hypothetical protein